MANKYKAKIEDDKRAFTSVVVDLPDEQSEVFSYLMDGWGIVQVFQLNEKNAKNRFLVLFGQDKAQAPQTP